MSKPLTDLLICVYLCKNVILCQQVYRSQKKLSNSLKGHHVSDETREKIRQKTKARVQGKNNPKAVKVKIKELNKTFYTIGECCEFLGVNRNAIARNKKGNMSKVKGYNINFEDEA